MKKVALITGASGGIGLGLANRFANDKIDLLLVARNEAKLQSLKQQIEKEQQVKVDYLAADLSTPDGLKAVKAYTEQNNLDIDYLVNNAGFGDYGAFVERSMEKYREMIELNVASLVELTHYFSKRMVARGSGKILNIASTAGFQPNPSFAVYGATKAFVISFTEALSNELEGTGVTVTLLSPGPTATGFSERADMNKTTLFQHGVMSVDKVSAVGYKAMQEGKLHVIPGFSNRLVAFLSNLLPTRSRFRLSIIAKISRRTNQSGAEG